MPSTDGKVDITIDHTVYKPGDVIQVSVVNRSAINIYANDLKATCSILGLQVRTTQGWQGTNVARCPQQRLATTVEIKAGDTYNTRISASYPGLKAATFPPGTYRLVLGYSTSLSASSEIRGYSGSLTTIYSPEFVVTAS